MTSGPGAASGRPRVVVAHFLPAAGLEPLRDRFEVWTSETRPTAEDLERQVRGAAALIADPTVTVDGALLDAAGPALQIVANFAAGYDNIDLDACRARAVVATNTPDVLTNATAELTVALMLVAARRIGEGERLVRAGRWGGWHPEQLLGRELAASTIGVVGLGRIATRVADLEERLGLSRLSLDDLLAKADIVSLHVPLTAKTHHMIDRAKLARFKPGSILVNTARGGLVDTPALVEALTSGPLAAAALDVYEAEPAVPRELLELENVVLAPHLGSATRRARDGMARVVAENVIAVLEGAEPVTPITPNSVKETSSISEK